MRVPHSEFLTRLAEMFARAATENSVYVTMKRLDNEEPASVLYRVTDGKKTKKTKLSTVVPPTDILAFESEYLTVLRTQLVSMLKKRDKAKERKVDKLLASSRKKLEENNSKVPIKGSSTYSHLPRTWLGTSKTYACYTPRKTPARRTQKSIAPQCGGS